jgi:hypothetical protein
MGSYYFAATVAAHCYCAYMRMPAWWLITVPLMFVSSAGTLVPLSTLARKAIELPMLWFLVPSRRSPTFSILSSLNRFGFQIMPATGKTVFWVLKPFVSDLKMKIGNFSAVLESSFISVLIFFPCSGLECVAFLLFGLCISDDE